MATKSLPALRRENLKILGKIDEFKASAELKNALEVISAGTRANSIQSLASGLGAQSNITSILPAIQNNIYANVTMNWNMLQYMYTTHGIIQAMIDMPVLDAFRGGLTLHSNDLSESELDDLSDEIEEREILERLADSVIWARLFGGGALIVNTAGDPARPMGEDELKGGRPFEFYDANRWELASPNGFRTSETYQFYGRTLHASRVLTITGKRAPWQIRWQLGGWGMSEMARIIEDFNLFLRTRNVLYELLNEAKIDVYQLKGFNSLLATADGTRKTRERVQSANEIKTYLNALVMDLEDKYEQKQITFAGLAEVMKENRMGLAAAARMPLTKLFGISASGFSSGEEDLENYNAMCESEVRQRVRSPIRKVLNMLVLARYGEKLDIGFDFKPLRLLNALDQENVNTQKQARYLGLYDRGLMDSHELGQAIAKDKLIPIEIKAAKGELDAFPAPPAGSNAALLDSPTPSASGKTPPEAPEPKEAPAAE